LTSWVTISFSRRTLLHWVRYGAVVVLCANDWGMVASQTLALVTFCKLHPNSLCPPIYQLHEACSKLNTSNYKATMLWGLLQVGTHHLSAWIPSTPDWLCGEKWKNCIQIYQLSS
jgi:hypothetical protein